jgi:general secretion pathway protein G
MAMIQFRLHKFYIWCLWQAKGRSLAFTLIEIMVVIAIIGTLSAIAIPPYLSYIKRLDNTDALSDIRVIEEAINDYLDENGELPDSLDDVGLGDMEDPWGNPYVYLRIDGGKVKGKGKLRKDHSMVPVNTDYDLYSKGKDGKSQTPFTAKASQDDIVRAQDGAFVGLVSDY